MPYVIRLLGCIRLLKPMGAVAATDQLIPLAFYSVVSYGRVGCDFRTNEAAT